MRSDDEVINFRKMLESLKAADLDEDKMNQLSLEIEEWVGDAYDHYGHQVGGEERALMAYRKKFPGFENEFHKKWNEAEFEESKSDWIMNKKFVMNQMIKKLQDSNILFTAFILNYLRAEGIDWPELDIIEKSVKKELSPRLWKMTLLGHHIEAGYGYYGEPELVVYIDHKIKTDMLALSPDLDEDLFHVAPRIIGDG